MDIILFGMQGSGKGTQGALLAERYGLKVMEMGQALRNIIASGSPLGNKIKAIVESGNLVDDTTILEVVKDFLSHMPDKQAVLFDGIPRTLKQKDTLMELLKEMGRDVFAVHIKVSESEAVKRMTLRARQDDSMEVIEKRLQNFKDQTLPVIQSFFKIDRLIEVDGEQKIEDVAHEMLEKTAYLFN